MAKKVLLVDDERNALLITGKFLTHLGFDHLEVSSGKEALVEIQNTHIDAVLLDHEMPEMNGIETAKNIRKLGGNFERIPIIMLTAHIQRDVLNQYKNVGINDYLIKPFDPKELKEVISKYIKENSLRKKEAKKQEKHNSQLIDLSYIQRLSYGDEAFKNEMIATIATDLPKLFRNLESNWETKNITELKQAVHKLNSPMSTIGLGGLNQTDFLLNGPKKDIFSQKGCDTLTSLRLLMQQVLIELNNEIKKFSQ